MSTPDLSPQEQATLARIEAAPYAPESWNPTVYGIRPHRLITADEDAMLRRAAESMPPITVEQLREQGLLP